MAFRNEEVLFNDTGTNKNAATIQAEAQRRAQLQAEINDCKNKMQSLYNLESKLNKCKEALSSTKDSFANGGHVYGGVALGSTEIESCIGNITSAVDIVKRLYGNYSTKLRQLNGSSNISNDL